MVGVELDDLYGLPLDSFIPERATLVRALRSAGEREQAATVAALRKPSVAAWAVNQLVRSQRGEVEALLRAGDALRETQAGVLSGAADAQDLRAAAEAERRAVDDLVETARGLLSSSGQELSATTLERVADTLNAAALDDEAREQVSEGRLVRELRHVGLGAGLGGGPAAAPTRPARARPDAGRGRTGDGGTKAAKRAGGQTAKQRQAAERRAREAEQREREAARKHARANERDAAREVERAERAVRGAEDRRDRAAEALRQAEGAAAEAQAALKGATAAHRQARQQLDSL
jgi:hypothetical protein